MILDDFFATRIHIQVRFMKRNRWAEIKRIRLRNTVFKKKGPELNWPEHDDLFWFAIVSLLELQQQVFSHILVENTHSSTLSRDVNLFLQDSFSKILNTWLKTAI